mgnify:FL=1
MNLALHSTQATTQIKTLPQISIELPSKLPNVLANIDGLVEVFTKLLDNACKFTPTDGKIVITAQVQTAENANSVITAQMLEIVIADTGRGIDRNQLNTIFDRFSQSEGYLRRTVNGAG